MIKKIALISVGTLLLTGCGGSSSATTTQDDNNSDNSLVVTNGNNGSSGNTGGTNNGGNCNNEDSNNTDGTNNGNNGGSGNSNLNDTDKDGVPDDKDNCPYNANPAQQDTDKDGKGDVCDEGLVELPSADFETRCDALGVLLCDGFDDMPPRGLGVDPKDPCSVSVKEMYENALDNNKKNDCNRVDNANIPSWRYISTSLTPIAKSDLPLSAPYENIKHSPAFDTNVKASGTGSLMYTMTSHTGSTSGSQTQNPDPASVGLYRTNFSTNKDIMFGPGQDQQHFYVQFSWYGSKNLLQFEDPLPQWVQERNALIREGKVKGKIVKPGDPRRFSSINCKRRNDVSSCESHWSNSAWKLIWVQPTDEKKWCDKFGEREDKRCRRPQKPCSNLQLIYPLMTGFTPNVIYGFHNCGWYEGYAEGTKKGYNKQPGGENECYTKSDGTVSEGCVQWVPNTWMTFKIRYDIGAWQSHCGTGGKNCKDTEPPKSRVQAWVKIGDKEPMKFLDHRFYNRGPNVPIGLLPEEDNHEGMEGNNNGSTKNIIANNWKLEKNGVYSFDYGVLKDGAPQYVAWDKSPLVYVAYSSYLGSNTLKINRYSYDAANKRIYVNVGTNPQSGELVAGKIGAAETYPGIGYGRIDIYPQAWLKDWRATHPDLFMWIDELIISREDIAWPKR